MTCNYEEQHNYVFLLYILQNSWDRIQFVPVNSTIHTGSGLFCGLLWLTFKNSPDIILWWKC
jgi:hypothetical protein